MSKVVFWVRSHIQPVMLTLGAIALAVKPEVVGTSHYGVVGWLTVALTAAGAVGTYIAPNLEGQTGLEVKDAVALLTAGFAAAINVAPNGFSRADIWVVGAAVVAIGLPMLVGNPTTRAVKAAGAGHMGDGGVHVA